MTAVAHEPTALETRCAKWREKYPQRAAALRLVVARLLGHPVGSPRVSAATLAAMCEPTEHAILAAVLTDEGAARPA